MSDTNSNIGAEGTENPTATETEVNNTGTEVTNADIKNSELFQKIAKENAELRAAEAARSKAEEEAKVNREREKLESEGKYKEALQLAESKLKSETEKFQKELLQRDLTTELLKAGFNNDVFIKGAISGFNNEEATVTDYVASLKSNEANAIFLDGANKRQTMTPPEKPGSSSAAMTVEEAIQISKNPNMTVEQKQPAWDLLKKHYSK